MHPFLQFTIMMLALFALARWQVEMQMQFFKSTKVSESSELSAEFANRVRRYAIGARIVVVAIWLLGLWAQLTVGFERLMA